MRRDSPVRFDPVVLGACAVQPGQGPGAVHGDLDGDVALAVLGDLPTVGHALPVRHGLGRLGDRLVRRLTRDRSADWAIAVRHGGLVACGERFGAIFVPGSRPGDADRARPGRCSAGALLNFCTYPGQTPANGHLRPGTSGHDKIGPSPCLSR
jgi:hypothetical protein